MHIAFVNPQGNFDPHDRYWTQHPDFGGQLVYVKQVALAMASLGHRVDILTRQIIDPGWPEFASAQDAYSDAPNVRILRFRAGPPEFLRKELLWRYLGTEWVPSILAFYSQEHDMPEAFTGHYGDGGLACALIAARTGIPFTFTGHSLGAQKMDKLEINPVNLADMNAHYHFGERLLAERLSMNHSVVNITSTHQERFEQYSHQAYRGAVDVNDDSRFAVIPPGVNLAIFDQTSRVPEEKAAQEHVKVMLARDIAAERQELPAIIASSRLDPKKNPLDLVRAFAQSPDLQRQANLVIFSGGHNDALRDDSRANPSEKQVLAEIRAVVEAHRLWGKISAFALPGQPALAAAYRLLAGRGSVFALTALYEPFGLAPLEAAAAGLPVVVTQNGGPSESLREGDREYGVLVDPADPAVIGRGLLRLIGQPRAWAEFARAGRQRILDRYTWERTAEGYLRQIERFPNLPARRSELPAQPALLPIHPFFLSGSPSDAVSLEQLKDIYPLPA